MQTKEPLTDYELHQMYNEMLDDVYDECSIAGYKYSTSQALHKIDPIAYRCGFNDWLDAQVTDGLLIETENEEYYQY